MNRDELPLEKVKIKNLIALQRKVDPEKVDSIRADIRAQKPGKAPLVFRYAGVDYIADGHHRVEAAALEGIEEIPARIKTLDLEKLAKAEGIAPVEPGRPFVVAHAERLAESLTATLAVVGRQFSEAVADKMAKAEDPIQAFLDSLESVDIYDLDDDDLLDALNAIAKDSGKIAVTSVGVNTGKQITGVINEAALAYSTERAGELISPKGLLITATKDMIRTTLSEGIAAGLSSEEIAEKLQAAYAFSPQRATLIAMTESARANSYGALDGYLAAKANGVDIKKSWVERDEDACEVCGTNAAQGAIELEEPFASGDMAPTAHPHCACVIVPVLGDN